MGECRDDCKCSADSSKALLRGHERTSDSIQTGLSDRMADDMGWREAKANNHPKAEEVHIDSVHRTASAAQQV
jgi:hypothetical protein